MLRRAASHHPLKKEQELHNKQSPNKLAAPDGRRCVFVVIYRVSPARLSDRICLRRALLVRTSHPLDSPNTWANVRCSSCWGQLLFESAWTVRGEGVFDLCEHTFVAWTGSTNRRPDLFPPFPRPSWAQWDVGSSFSTPQLFSQQSGVATGHQFVEKILISQKQDQ